MPIIFSLLAIGWLQGAPPLAAVVLVEAPVAGGRARSSCSSPSHRGCRSGAFSGSTAVDPRAIGGLSEALGGKLGEQVSGGAEGGRAGAGALQPWAIWGTAKHGRQVPHLTVREGNIRTAAHSQGSLSLSGSCSGSVSAGGAPGQKHLFSSTGRTQFFLSFNTLPSPLILSRASFLFCASSSL